MSTHEPSLQPPAENETMNGQNCPADVPPESALQASTGDGDTNDGVPTDEPPTSRAGAATGEAFGAATWHDNKKIEGLFVTKGNRNSWVYPTGLGWKKLANNSDSASVALTLLASHARQSNRTVKIKEDGGMITEMYVW